MKKSLLTGVLALTLVASLVGCGSTQSATPAPAPAGSDESATETVAEESVEETAEEAVEESTTSGGLTVASIQEEGVLHVGTDLTFEPYEYLDDSDTPTGYDIAIWNRVAEEMGVEVQFDDLAFSGIFAGLEAGKFDVAGCYCNINEERMQKYKFAIPVSFDEFYLVKRTDDDSITSLEDVNGKSVGVVLGTAPVDALDEYAKANYADGVTETAYDSSVSAFLDLLNGNVDLACESYTICKQQIDASEGQLEFVGSISKPIYGSFAFRAEDEELAAYVSGVIKKMKEDGSLAELQMEYCGVTYDDLPEDESEYIK